MDRAKEFIKLNEPDKARDYCDMGIAYVAGKKLIIPIEVGDTVMVGRFRNKPVKVKEIGIDELGQPTVNGNTILKFRIPKIM